MIRNEGLSSVNVMDMLTGKIPGTIGETSVIAILIGAIILILLGVITFTDTGFLHHYICNLYAYLWRTEI